MAALRTARRGLAWRAVALAACLAPGAADASPLALTGELQPGPHSVGFHKEVLPRTVADGGPTALNLYLWFPTEPGGSRPRVTLADYYRAQEATPPTAEVLVEWLLADMTSPPGIEASELERVLAAPLWARPAEMPRGGAHPLVLWSYRDSVPTMQAVLNEYLASHGYVVAFAWPADNAPPLPWQGDLAEGDKVAALGLQVDLLSETLDALLTRPAIDPERVAVLAWSYGGESAAGLQRRRSEVRLAAGVDATLVSGWIFDPAALDTLAPSSMGVPYALLRNGRPRIDGDPSTEPPLLARLPDGAWHVRFPQLSHGNFNFPGGMLPGVLGLEDVSSWAVGGDAARLGYEALCRHVLGILDLELRDGPEDPATWAAGLPAGFVDLVRHPPRRDP